MRQFINAKETLVTEALDGALRISGRRLARLDGYPHIKVVVRTDWDRSKVALVSGGGSGHEPSHAGFVGRGMLTAAVCGDVFASPSVDAVLAGILAVTGAAGCLLIVKNYTGDRLNFGLAAERARAFGLDVSMVVVDDDVALPGLPQARGVAGTLFVHKIAGALAESGADLEAVTRAAKQVIDGVISIGITLDTCTVPGSPKENRIADGKAELGLGIHGEAGVEQVDFKGARQAMEMIVDRLAPNIEAGPHVALLNNLGSATALEMSVLAEELVMSRIGGQISHLIGPAPMMTSLDMHGFSVSLLPLAGEALAGLQSDVAPWAWPGCNPVSEVNVLPLPDGLTPIQPMPSKNDQAETLIRRCCEILIAAEGDLNALDAKSGDGDTGSTLSTASRALIKALDRLPLADWTQLLPGDRVGAQPNDGRLFGRIACHILRGGRRRIRQRTECRGRPEGGPQPDPAGGRCRPGRPNDDRCPRPGTSGIALRLGRLSCCGPKRRQSHRNNHARQGWTRELYFRSNLAGHNDPGAEAVARLFEELLQTNDALV